MISKQNQMAIITIKATAAQPFPPILSDGTTTSNGTGTGDKDFTTEVALNETITFQISSDRDNVIKNITSISHNPTIFIQPPTKNQDGTWQASAANSPRTDGSYSISYEIEFRQDPKIKIK